MPVVLVPLLGKVGGGGGDEVESSFAEDEVAVRGFLVFGGRCRSMLILPASIRIIFNGLVHTKILLV